MKSVILGALVSILPMATFASEYAVTDITWCNGPHMGTDGSNCPSFSAWQQVQLKYLSYFSIDPSGSSQLIKLADSKGALWEQDLTKCKSASTDQSGCTFDVDNKDPATYKLRITLWSDPYSKQSLALYINRESDVDVIGPDDSYFNFSIIKK